MLAQHRFELAGVPETELPQQHPQGRGRVHPVEQVGIPPECCTSRSSMLCAPAHIPAITLISFGTGFADPDRIRGFLIDTLPVMISGSRVCWANPSTGTNPAHDTRLSSSKRTDSVVNLCETRAESAFHELRRHFPRSRAAHQRRSSTDQAKLFPVEGAGVKLGLNLSGSGRQKSRVELGVIVGGMPESFVQRCFPHAPSPMTPRVRVSSWPVVAHLLIGWDAPLSVCCAEVGAGGWVRLVMSDTDLSRLVAGRGGDRVAVPDLLQYWRFGAPCVGSGNSSATGAGGTAMPRHCDASGFGDRAAAGFPVIGRGAMLVVLRR